MRRTLETSGLISTRMPTPRPEMILLPGIAFKDGSPVQVPSSAGVRGGLLAGGADPAAAEGRPGRHSQDGDRDEAAPERRGEPEAPGEQAAQQGAQRAAAVGEDRVGAVDAAEQPAGDQLLPKRD